MSSTRKLHSNLSPTLDPTHNSSFVSFISFHLWLSVLRKCPHLSFNAKGKHPPRLLPALLWSYKALSKVRASLLSPFREEQQAVGKHIMCFPHYLWCRIGFVVQNIRTGATVPMNADFNSNTLIQLQHATDQSIQSFHPLICVVWSYLNSLLSATHKHMSCQRRVA